MLTLNHVYKDYDFRPVLEDVTLTLIMGQRYILQAPNGAGKTTLLHIMAGLTKCSAGDVLYFGQTLGRDYRRDLGVVFGDPFAYGNYTAEENLEFYAKVYGLREPRLLANTWVNDVGLRHARTMRVNEFSKGMKQRLSIARALIHRPKVVLLDEPFDGLDDEGRDLATRLVENQLQEGSTIFMVTHHDREPKRDSISLTIKLGRLVAT